MIVPYPVVRLPGKVLKPIYFEGKGVAMGWPDYFPENCPPKDAEQAHGEVYRLVNPSRAIESGFACFRMLNIGAEVEECLRCGLSVSRDLESCMRQQRRVPSLRKKQIYRANFESPTGVIKQTTEDKTHFTWWLPVEIKAPWEYFHLVNGESLTEVGA